MKNKKWLTVILCLCMSCALIISGAALVKYKFTASSGETVIKTVNRVDIAVSDTEFIFNKADKDGLLVCTTRVSIGKTEADFYGVLGSITLNGQELNYTVFTAGKNNPGGDLPENLILPVNDSGAYPLEWEITFAVPYQEGVNTYDLSLDFHYTTGLKTNTAQKYKTSVPIVIKVE